MNKLIANAFAAACAALSLVSAEAVAAELPSGYQAMSRLVAEGGGQNGMPFINTGVRPDQNTRVVMSVEVKGTHEYWFGCWDAAYNNGAFAMGNDVGDTYVGWDGQGGGVSGYLVPNGLHVLDLNAGRALVDGNVIRTFDASTFSLNQILYLFAQNRSGSPSYRLGSSTQVINCYYCKIYDGETLVRDYVPCLRIEDEEAGLYDMVNGCFCPNNGTGKLMCEDSLLVKASATGYEGLAQPGGSCITVQVVNPPNGQGCSYEWSLNGGATWTDVKPLLTEAGLYEVFCRVSCEGYASCTVSATVRLFAHEPTWTYDATTGVLSDGTWKFVASKEDDELTIVNLGETTLYQGIQLDLSKPVAGDLRIVAIGSSVFSFVNKDEKESRKLTRVVLPDTLRTIGESAFYACRGLTEVTPFLPSSVTTIGGNAFERCEALRGDLVIGAPSGEPTRWWGASRPPVGQFAHTGIDSVTLLTATNLPKWMCIECPNLVRVEMTDAVREIATYAFSGCTSLTTVTPFLPSAIETIGAHVFKDCPSLGGDLTIGRIEGPTVVWTDAEEDGCQFKRAAGITSVTLNAVTNVPNDCFNYCSAITGVVIRSELVEIGRFAFGMCSALKTVTPFLPCSVRQIGGSAFYQCYKLEGDVEVGSRKADLNWVSRHDPKLSWVTRHFAECYPLRSMTINGEFDRLPTDYLAMCDALETVRINNRRDFIFGMWSLAGWSGHNPPIRDLYVNSYTTFEEDVLRYRPAQTLRFWVPGDNAQWQAWAATNVDLWENLTDDQRAGYYAEFGANAKRPVGLTHDNVQPAAQWLMWQPKSGLLIVVE